MPTSKRRKAGRAAAERTIPVTIRYSRDEEIYLMLAPHMALVNVREGLGDRTQWQALCLRVNVGQILCNRYFAHIDEALQAMETAVRAISTLGKRFTQSGVMVMTGDECRAIGRGLTLTDAMQENTTKREQRNAYYFAKQTMGMK